MISALQQLQGRFSFDVDVVDVDSRPELEEKWGDKVPVLLDGEIEICHYHLDVPALDARLARMK
ncbi:glutaredoxin family protein [Usitatibacter rugosus]